MLTNKISQDRIVASLIKILDKHWWHYFSYAPLTFRRASQVWNSMKIQLEFHLSSKIFVPVEGCVQSQKYMHRRIFGHCSLYWRENNYRYLSSVMPCTMFPYISISSPVKASLDAQMVLVPFVHVSSCFDHRTQPFHLENPAGTLSLREETTESSRRSRLAWVRPIHQYWVAYSKALM